MFKKANSVKYLGTKVVLNSYFGVIDVNINLSTRFEQT